MRNLRVLVFGGCNTKDPLFQAAGRWPRDPAAVWDDAPSNIELTGAPFFTFTLGEMLQAVACYRGERHIAPEFLGLCNMRPDTAPSVRNSPLTITDVAVIEPNTSVEIELDGMFLNRGPVVRLLLPLREIGPIGKRAYFEWYSKGIVNCDREIRRSAAERILPLISSDLPDRELIVTVIKHANGRRSDVQSDLRRLRDALGIPCGVVAYTWSYMPDGRALSWPSEFHTEVIEAAKALEAPIFDPRSLVQQAGATTALKSDLRHYAATFIPVVAKSLVAFAHSISPQC